MPTIIFHMPNDTPIIESWPEETTRSELQRRAAYHRALHYDTDESGGEFDPYCQACGRKLRHSEEVGTYCPSGCRFF